MKKRGKYTLPEMINGWPLCHPKNKRFRENPGLLYRENKAAKAKREQSGELQ